MQHEKISIEWSPAKCALHEQDITQTKMKALLMHNKLLSRCLRAFTVSLWWSFYVQYLHQIQHHVHTLYFNWHKLQSKKRNKKFIIAHAQLKHDLIHYNSQYPGKILFVDSCWQSNLFLCKLQLIQDETFHHKIREDSFVFTLLVLISTWILWMTMIYI